MPQDVVQTWNGRPQVYLKENWTDPWLPLDEAIGECLSLTLALGHAVDQASLIVRSGDIFVEDIDHPAGGEFVHVDPFAYLNWFVRIQASGIDWVGIITSEDRTDMDARDDGSGNRVAGSDQIYTALGMEWLLDRRQIISTVFWGDPDEKRSQRGLGFNMGAGNERDPSAKDRGNKDTRTASSGKPSFAADTNNAEEWNASEMIQHLLEFHGPSDVNFAQAAPEFTFDVVTYGPFLEWYRPGVSLEGRTVLEVIREIISPRRGLVWWLQYAPDADPAASTMELHVASVFSSIVTLPGGDFLPANLNQTPLVVYSDADFNPLMHRVRRRRDRTRQYDRVRVRGAHRVSVFTVSPADGNLVPGWNTSVYELDYKNAGGATNAEAADRYRRSEDFTHVYSRYVLDSNWDGQSSDGSGSGSFQFACPSMPQNSNSILDGERFSAHGLRLLRTLPLKQGYDYTDATAITVADPSNEPAELMMPFGIIKHNNKWTYLDRAATSQDEAAAGNPRLKTSYHLRMLDTIAGVDILPAGGMPHVIAKNHFDTGTPAPSKTRPEVDYEDMRLTVAAEWESYCEGYYPDASPAASPLHELVIYIGDSPRLDYLAAGTIFDLQGTSIRTVGTGGPLRDDRDRCFIVAKIAYEWYDAERVAFEIESQRLAFGSILGWFITHLTDFGGVLNEPANVVVSQIAHDFRAGRSTISADFTELDFGAFV